MTITDLSPQSRATDVGDVPALRFRRTVAGFCLMTAPLAFAAAEMLAPGIDGASADSMLDAFAAHRPAALLASGLGLLSTLLFLPAIFGLLTPITRRGSRWGHIALAAVLYGLVTAHAALTGINLMFWAMSDPSLDRGQMVRLLDILHNTPAVGAPLLIGHYIFALGVVALGIAITRSRIFPHWTGFAVIAAVIVDIVADVLPITHEPGEMLSNLLFITGLAAIDICMLRRGSV